MKMCAKRKKIEHSFYPPVIETAREETKVINAKSFDPLLHLTSALYKGIRITDRGYY